MAESYNKANQELEWREKKKNKSIIAVSIWYRWEIEKEVFFSLLIW